jgi:hypothetical protein
VCVLDAIYAPKFDCHDGETGYLISYHINHERVFWALSPLEMEHRYVPTC